MKKRVVDQFHQEFTLINLGNIFNDHIKISSAKGIDQISARQFQKNLEKHLLIIYDKIGIRNPPTYKFTKYKSKLISKGKGKAPREISIPTVRDRIVLRAICNFLQSRFTNIKFPLPQLIIHDVKEQISSGLYSSFIKLDVKNFYPSIEHTKLGKQLNKRLRNPEIRDFIMSAVRTPTVSVSRRADPPNKEGVPQGLSISNILASIYLQNIDKYFSELPNAKVYRYVDDILVLCHTNDLEILSTTIIKKFKSIGLTIHPLNCSDGKSKHGKINDDFIFLGYKFSETKVSVRDTSLDSFRNSLIGIFTSYKHAKSSNTEYLRWRLNLRITGCIFENKCKGWMFYFSEMNDESLLHQIDHFVKKLCSRFNVRFTPKKLTKTYKEILHCKYNTNYIPNFDRYTDRDKRALLKDVFKFDHVSSMSESDVDYWFRKKIGYEIRDLEEDIATFS